MCDYKYKFSIVTAVYNVELFVAETIESLIGQDIGFENIQLILVDDGSPDKSGEICDSYAKKYSNIKVIHKENGGVSSARNEGLRHIEGKYVNFLDSDDLLSKNTLSKVWKLFEGSPDKTDVVAIPIELFDGQRGGHPLNYKFGKGTRIVDLKDEWDCIQLSAACAFVRSSAIKDLIFDSRLAFAEDAKFMQLVLAQKQTIGLEADSLYLYRKRLTGALSALENAANNPKWYTTTLEYFSKDLINIFNEKYSNVPKFAQFAIMYDMQWRVKKADVSTGVLTPKEEEEYLKAISDVLSFIDEDIIMAQKNIFREHKIQALRLKYGREPEKSVKKDDIAFSFTEQNIFRISKCLVSMEFINVSNNTLEIEGVAAIYSLPFKNFDFFVMANGKKYPCIPVERKKIVVSLGSEILTHKGFKVTIPLEKNNNYSISFGACVDGADTIFKKLSAHRFAPVNNNLNNSYCKRENWIIATNKNTLKILPYSFIRHFVKELKFVYTLLRSGLPQYRAAFFYRFLYRVTKVFKRKPVWLISDRPNRAGDNGEAFFRYMRKTHPEIDTKFVISKNSQDYSTMKKVGPVLEPQSVKHKLNLLISDYIISSQGEDEHFNPFKNQYNGVRDILNMVPFIFIQHGIIKNDLSNWLNKYNKNIKGFVTTAKGEYNSILEYPYYYTEKEVWLTGIPRLDRLYDEPKNEITLMPTWRKYLTRGRDPVLDKWMLISDFKESTFFKFYNSLINDEKLLECAKKHGYKINVLFHPNLRPAVEYFDKNNLVNLISEDIPYRDIYARSNLVLTDYSSAAFDFAYLRKPIIYTHFDYDDFFGGSHTISTGYFDDVRDGLGEVEYDLDGTVNRIIEYMENGCQLKDKYRQRMDSFFAFDDKNNCQRLYEKLAQKN